MALSNLNGWNTNEDVKATAACGKKLDDKVEEIFHNYRKTHNDGVFDVYTPDIRAARSSHLLTGLPDGYGRGRIIGDYRRIALYGVDILIEEKKFELEELNVDNFTDEIIRSREEISEQIKALNELKVRHQNMDLIYQFLQKMQKKLYNGYILDI